MNEIKSGEAVATATIQITRKETGKVEEYTLTFTPVINQTQEENEDVSHTPNSVS